MNSKRTALCILLVTFWALPLLAATGSAYWTGGAGQDPGAIQWDEDANWDPEQHPVDSDTATFDGTLGTGLPDANLPAAGAISFAIMAGQDLALDDYLDGATIGDATFDNSGGACTIGVAVSGNIALQAGDLEIGDGVTVGGTILVSAMGFDTTLAVNGTVTVTGKISLYTSGTIEVEGGEVLDANGGIESVDGGTIACDGTIRGWIDANGQTLTWTGSGTITVDVAGTLDLGTGYTDNNQTVDVQANTIIGASFRCHNLTGTGGVITGGGYTVTVGSGGLVRVGATLDGPGTLHVTFAEATTAAEWDAVDSRLGTVTFDAAVTIGDADLNCRKVAGAGTITSEANTKELFVYEPGANDFWTHTGDVTTTGTGEILIRLAASRSNAAAIGGAGSNADLAIWCANGVTFTASADVALGTGDLRIYANEDGWCGL